MPPSTEPAPVYIAPSAASQIITADQEFNTVDFVGDEHEDGSSGSAGALVTADALGLLNGFLDHLLFNILAVAKSSQLSNIRPAVADVLKPRLAREVVAAADYELSDYMGGEGDEFDFRGGQKPTGDFDLIRSWKRTRLRCMVYTRLGDMEEDEEDEYISRDGLTDTANAPRRFSSHIDIVTPAAAIFLTSIIEHLGEQALVIAGETSRSRLSSKLSKEHDEVTESGTERGRINRLVVEDYDMEKLAMNATLGRLWRTWRQRVRSPRLSHTLSRESFRPPRGIASTLASSRKSSVGTIDEFPARSVTSFDTAEAHEEEAQEGQQEQEQEVDPISIPLPMSQFDVQEILIPGFVGEPVGDIQTMEAVVAHKVRPRSLMVLPSPLSPRTPSSVESSPVIPSESRRLYNTSHARSQSMPTHYTPPAEAASDEDRTPVAESKEEEHEQQLQEQVEQLTHASSPTASEKRRRLETMYEQEEEPAEFVDARTDPQDAQSGMAISTSDATKSSVTDTTRVVDAEPASEKRKSDAARQSMFAPSLSGASVVVEVSRPGSAQTAYLADEAQRERENAEIIEGQGMAEKPRPGSAIQRPRRKASGDPKKASRSSSITTSERAVEDRSSKQGTPAQNIPDDASSKIAEARKSANQTWFLHHDGDDDDDEDDDEEKKKKEEEEEEENKEEAKDADPATAGGSSSAAVAAAAAAAGATAAATAATAAAVAGSSSAGPQEAAASPAVERAAVQRIPSQPPTPSKSSRRSESLSEKRPVTSGSANSQSSLSKLKGKLGRTPQDEGAHVRGSSEASAHSSGENSPALEQLIQSEETIHYTLTPKSMRDMEQPAPRSNKANRSSTADLASFLMTTAPPGEEPPTRTSAPKATPKAGSVPKHQPIATSAPPKPALAVPRSKMAGLARDAKPTSDSTRDFADFIKSTGPAGPSPASPISPAVSSSNRSNRLSDVTDPSKKVNRPGSGLSNSTRGSSRLQARAAVAPKGEQTSELIDFIREGPPDPGSHRIPRTVAPFRSTMDSDDMKGHNVQDSRSTSPDGSGPGKSLSSFGSRTGLLKSSREPAQQKTTATSTSKPAPAPAPAPAPKTDDFDAPMPVRKQRRVPDPYAIDDDDDEALEELLGLQDKPKREEESLIDFLRNASPPPEDPTPRAPIMTSSTASHKSSSGGMRARFLRSASEMAPMSKASKTSLRSAQSDIRSPSATQSNYTTKPVAASKPPTPSSPPNTLGRQTETSALADFLKNTEPPEPPRAPTAFAMNRGKDSNGLSRLLMRRKKVEV